MAWTAFAGYYFLGAGYRSLSALRYGNQSCNAIIVDILNKVTPPKSGVRGKNMRASNGEGYTGALSRVPPASGTAERPYLSLQTRNMVEKRSEIKQTAENDLQPSYLQVLLTECPYVDLL